MNEQLSLLIRLQEIDARIRTQRDEQSRIPGRLAALDQRDRESQEGLRTVQESLEAAQKAKRDRDRDLEEGGRKVEKLKARTSEIKTNKEYQALLKEIETAEQENKAIEDDILKLMEKIDAAAAEIKNAEQRSATESAAVNDERKSIEADQARLGGELDAEQNARKEIAAGIEAALLAQYEKRIGSLAGRVVVEARGEACSGCFMSIPPQVFVNVKKNEEIISCPNCHRILYYKEAIAPAG